MDNYRDQCKMEPIHKMTMREKLKAEITIATESIKYNEERIKDAKSILAKLDKNKDLEAIVDFLK